MIKGPTLLSLDCKTGAVRRYFRRYNVFIAGIGWQLERVGSGRFDPFDPPALTELERFRVSGVA